VTRRLTIFGRAKRHIREALDWWDANRAGAPTALRDDLRNALELIRAQPGAGASASNASLPGLRRIHLARVRYHLYYRLSPDGEAVEVIDLWHASRGEPPMK